MSRRSTFCPNCGAEVLELHLRDGITYLNPGPGELKRLIHECPPREPPPQEAKP